MAESEQGGPGRPSEIIGRYEVLREIGRGGMAVVYAARQPDLDRQVALKELSRFHAGSREYAHRFLRESRLAGSLNHPNIVTVHEYFEHNTIPYIAMEYVPRGSLRPYMKRLTISQIAGVLEGVLAGLAHGEAAGIVHRDLKPENIMVTSDGRVKITDFGIARATYRAGTQYMTATGMTVGTPTYMAPEQAMAGDIGSWSDLYSVGVLTYELVVGQVPFHDTEAPMVILMRHVNERIPPAIEVRPDVDPNLSAWIDSLLVKDPKHRVHHALDAWESLEEIIVGLLGPLWRRNARLLDDQMAVEKAVPLTPAPFESQPSIRTPTPASSQAVPAQDEFVTFDPAQPPTPAPSPPVTPAPSPPSPSATPPAAIPVTPTPSAPAPSGEAEAPVVATPPAQSTVAATPVVETPAGETPAAEPPAAEPTPSHHVGEAAAAGAAALAAAAAGAGLAEHAASAAPVAEPPTAEPPVAEHTASAAPLAEPPLAEPPAAEPPVAEPAPPDHAPEAEPKPEPESEFVTYNPSPAAAPEARRPAPPTEAPPIEAAPVEIPPEGEPTAQTPEPKGTDPGLTEAGIAAAGVAQAESHAEPETQAGFEREAEPGAAPDRESEPDTALEPQPEAEVIPLPEREPDADGIGAREAEAEAEAESELVPPHLTPPEPVPAAAVAAPARRREAAGRTPFVALAAVAAIVGAVIGFVIAPSSSHTTTRPPAPLSQTTAAGPLKISFPADWQQSATVPAQAASLKLANAVTLTPGGTGGALVLGSNSSVEPNLLPASFVTALGTSPTGAAVTIGAHTFKRYLNLVPQNTTTGVSVYALPTAGAGTAIAACLLPSSGADAFNATCEHILTSLQIPGSQLPLTASPTYAQALSAAVAKLGRVRASAGGQLAAARHPAGQAAAAHTLAGAYQQAAGTVTKLAPGPVAASANTAIAAALRKLAAGYQSLSAAAAHNNKKAYAAAQSEIGRAQSALTGAFAQLRADGYTLG
jgi:serine/threonine protein kinase